MSGAGASMQNVASVNSNLAGQTEAINVQMMSVQEQIRQSEQNLSAQHSVSIVVLFCVVVCVCVRVCE